jgi:hypothetical protein
MAPSFEPGSNVTAPRDEQPLKQKLASHSTGDGIQIDESDEQFANASF